MDISSTAPPPSHEQSNPPSFDDLPYPERIAIYAKLATRLADYGCGEEHDPNPSVPEMRGAIRRLELAMQRVEQARELITMPAEVVGIGWRFLDEPWAAGTVVSLLDHVERNLKIMFDAARCQVTITSNDLDVVDGGDAIARAVLGVRPTTPIEAVDAVAVPGSRNDFVDALKLLGFTPPEADDLGPRFDETKLSTMRSGLARVALAKELQHRALDLIRQPVEDGTPGWCWTDDIVARWYLTLGENAEEQLDGLYGSVLCTVTSKANDEALLAGGAL